MPANKPGSEDRSIFDAFPQSIPSEQAVLGALLADNTAYDDISNVISVGDFSQISHRLIFAELEDLIRRGEHADIITLLEALKKKNLAEEAGGMAYLVALTTNAGSTVNIRKYAELIRDSSMRRQLIEFCDRTAEKAAVPESRTPEELIEDADRALLDIMLRTERDRSGFKTMEELAAEFTSHIVQLSQEAEAGRGFVTGVSTGYTNLDKVTSGFQPGNLIILAGRPSMGKTAFALNIAENVAIRQEKPVAFFSMEMGAEEIIQRLVSSYANINSQTLRTGKLNDEDWDNLVHGIERISSKPIYVDDTGALSVGELAGRARRLIRKHGPLSLIVIDYIQLMAGSKKTENRTQELSEISRGLKGLAKELHVPILALSQLNRSVDSRADRRPMMSDLRESGAIEQDADIIMFVYRDSMYNRDTPDKTAAEIIISKQRNGPTGTLRMIYRAEVTRFEVFAKDEGYI